MSPSGAGTVSSVPDTVVVSGAGTVASGSGWVSEKTI